ncbi:transactivating tegument protein VP16 [Bovine alphaherpesvirus 2]|uniref:Alpha trans-inducing protein n=1 Tax=Bovine alphaherpesvirus 2 TaxID=10295 RepID=A0ABX6WM14_9ALPH|nr:transactivating tegument protein VP16 [Bovine alphaherpesvirus 2]QPO25181.1 transactivating tegument protein VP16 [Bovine alphaherpesvirus 2]
MDALLDEILGDGNGGVVVGQEVIMPPPPLPAPPAVLHTHLLEDLGFSEGPALLTDLDGCNEDLFSCLPTNADLYRDCRFLSTIPADVIAWGDAYTPDRTAINIRAHGRMRPPALPTDERGLVGYHDALMAFFGEELRAREPGYVRVLGNFCSALYRYIRASTRQLHRQSAMRGRARSLTDMLHAAVAERYYREAARLARTLLLHMYLSLVREVSWASYAEQVLRQDVFSRLRYDLQQERQLSCIFQPILFVHGAIDVGGASVPRDRLRAINHVRERLNLPLVRCSAVEEAGQPPTTTPPFNSSRARSSGFLMLVIRAKLDAYSLAHPAAGSEVLRDHAYSRSANKANYGSSVEGMLDLSEETREVDVATSPPPVRVSLAPVGPGKTARASGPESGPRAGNDRDPRTHDVEPMDMEGVMDAMEAINDFDLSMLDDPPSPAIGAEVDTFNQGGFEVLDLADLEFEQMFVDALGIAGGRAHTQA